MGSPSGHERRRHAFTLVEMLVAMGIIATVGVMVVVTMVSAGQRSAREGAREDVMDVLRQARMSAMDSGRGSLVRINTSEGAVYGLASSVVAAWHFETFDPVSSVTPGAKSMNATVYGATIESGKVGLCLSFDGSADYVDCNESDGDPDPEFYPVYDRTEGIRLEAWVRPEGGSAGPPPELLGVIGKSDGGSTGYMLGLECTADAATYRAHGGCYTDGSPTAYVHLMSAPAAMLDSQWYHLAFEFDGYEGRLFIDGRMVDLDSYRLPEDGLGDPNPVQDPNATTDVDWLPPARIIPARAAPLYVGRVHYAFGGGPPADYYFQGLIDEPKLLSVAAGEPVHLPHSVPIVVSDPVVHFDSLGRLDTAYHGGGSIYIAVGDPYQTAKLDADLAAGATSLTVAPTNPFAPTGGIVMVGPPGGPYEVMQYGSVPAGSPVELQNLSGHFNFGQVLGASWDHYVADDERVFFARVIEVDPMGEVHRKTLPN